MRRVYGVVDSIYYEAISYHDNIIHTLDFQSPHHLNISSMLVDIQVF